MKRVTRILFTCILLPLAACKLSAKSVAQDSIRPYSPYTFREKENYPETTGYWYIGAGYSVPFMFGDMSSLTNKHDFYHFLSPSVRLTAFRNAVNRKISL